MKEEVLSEVRGGLGSLAFAADEGVDRVPITGAKAFEGCLRVRACFPASGNHQSPAGAGKSRVARGGGQSLSGQSSGTVSVAHGGRAIGKHFYTRYSGKEGTKFRG